MCRSKVNSDIFLSHILSGSVAILTMQDKSCCQPKLMIKIFEEVSIWSIKYFRLSKTMIMTFEQLHIWSIRTKNQCHLKEILCIIRLWDEVVDELGKEPWKNIFCWKSLHQLIMTVVEMAKKECHYGITTFRRQSSETIVKSRKRFFSAQVVWGSLWMREGGSVNSSDQSR